MIFHKKYILKNDIIVFFVIAVFALIMFLFYSFITSKDEYLEAKIYYNKEIIETIDLLNEENKIFSLKQLPNIKFEIKDKKIRFKESDCPDKVCVNTGFINNVGQTSVCLPNKVSIRIVSKSNTNDNEFDAVS